MHVRKRSVGVISATALVDAGGIDAAVVPASAAATPERLPVRFSDHKGGGDAVNAAGAIAISSGVCLDAAAQRTCVGGVYPMWTSS